MGFSDNYTNIKGAKKTNRYQAIGNSWAVPVIEWIGRRLMLYEDDSLHLSDNFASLTKRLQIIGNESFYINFGKDIVKINEELALNCTSVPEESRFSDISTIVSPDAPEDIYISPKGCRGIIRRKRGQNINPRLEEILLETSSKASEFSH